MRNKRTQKPRRSSYRYDIEGLIKSIVEVRESIKELRESIRESKEKADKEIRELRESQREADEALRKKIENLGREIGKLRDSQSDFMEGIVLPSAEKFVRSLGFKITDILQNYELKDEKGEIIAEYDAILISGSDVFIVEVKSSAGSRDIDRFIENIHKFNKSKIIFSRVYGIIASARFKNGTDKYALRKGLAVMKPSGEILVPAGKTLKPILKNKANINRK